MVRLISQFFKNVVPIVPGFERKKSSSDQLKTQNFFGASRQKFCSANSPRFWNTAHKYTCAINFVYVVITVLVPEIFCKKVVPIVPPSLSITQVYWVLVTVRLSRVHVKEVKLTYGFPFKLVSKNYTVNFIDLCQKINCKITANVWAFKYYYIHIRIDSAKILKVLSMLAICKFTQLVS